MLYCSAVAFVTGYRNPSRVFFIALLQEKYGMCCITSPDLPVRIRRKSIRSSTPREPNPSEPTGREQKKNIKQTNI